MADLGAMTPDAAGWIGLNDVANELYTSEEYQERYWKFEAEQDGYISLDAIESLLINARDDAKVVVEILLYRLPTGDPAGGMVYLEYGDAAMDEADPTIEARVWKVEAGETYLVTAYGSVWDVTANAWSLEPFQMIIRLDGYHSFTAVTPTVVKTWSEAGIDHGFTPDIYYNGATWPGSVSAVGNYPLGGGGGVYSDTPHWNDPSTIQCFWSLARQLRFFDFQQSPNTLPKAVWGGACPVGSEPDVEFPVDSLFRASDASWVGDRLTGVVWQDIYLQPSSYYLWTWSTGLNLHGAVQSFHVGRIKYAMSTQVPYYGADLASQEVGYANFDAFDPSGDREIEYTFEVAATDSDTNTEGDYAGAAEKAKPAVAVIEHAHIRTNPDTFYSPYYLKYPDDVLGWMTSEIAAGHTIPFTSGAGPVWTEVSASLVEAAEAEEAWYEAGGSPLDWFGGLIYTWLPAQMLDSSPPDQLDYAPASTGVDAREKSFINRPLINLRVTARPKYDKVQVVLTPLALTSIDGELRTTGRNFTY